MEPTECKICGKREWRHVCKGGTKSAEPARKSSKKPVSPKKKLTKEGRLIVENPVPDWQQIEEIMARLESLEARVLELEARKKYMKDYMARKRAKEKG